MNTTLRTTRPYERRLDQHLVLRSVRDERDVERFAAFNTAINDAQQGNTCAQLLRYHPAISFDDFLLVEDQTTGEVVSTTCLIPWRCQFEDVTLEVAMLEMVVSDPAYRRRGLVRVQIDRFHEVVDEQGFDLSIIEGIPYYYRQFGYGYATDHYGYDLLPAWRVPAPAAAPTPAIALRRASGEDVQRLTELYGESNTALEIYMLRDAAYWQFLIEEQRYPVWMIAETGAGQASGYLCQTPLAGGKSVRVIESVLPNAGVGLALLQHLASATAREIQIGWPPSSRLGQLGRSLGSIPMPDDQWLVRLADPVAFLRKIGPVLEGRLAVAGWVALTADVTINLYRQAYLLKFVGGRLQAVSAAGFVDASMGADGGDLCIPPEAFIRLLFGYRTLDELRDAWPDLVVKPASRPLLEALFPKRSSFFLLPYLYRG